MPLSFRISMIALFGLLLLVPGCATHQPSFPTPAMQATRCGGSIPCAPCGDAPGLGRCFSFPLSVTGVQMAPTHGVAVLPEPEAAEDTPKWNCKDSAFEGDQVWTCHEGLLHRCEGGKPVTINCSRGCESMELGEDDTCSS